MTVLDPRLCEYCAPLASVDLAQWAHRQRNFARYPHVGVHPCEMCGSTAWATIKPEEGDTPPRAGLGAAAWVWGATGVVAALVLALTSFGLVVAMSAPAIDLPSVAVLLAFAASSITIIALAWKAVGESAADYQRERMPPV